MPQFNSLFYFSQIFWLVVAFSLLYFIVNKFIAPKAEQILKNRQDTITNDVNEAELLVKKTKELETSYNNGIGNIINNSENLKKEALANLEASFVVKKKDLLNKIEKQTKKASEDIAKAIALYRLEEEAACINLAAFVAKKIVNQQPEYQLLKNCYEKIK